MQFQKGESVLVCASGSGRLTRQPLDLAAEHPQKRKKSEKTAKTYKGWWGFFISGRADFLSKSPGAEAPVLQQQLGARASGPIFFCRRDVACHATLIVVLVQQLL